jgi:type II secretory pathway pseudopilin PulG
MRFPQPSDGRRRVGPGRGPGFSLEEILMVLALIGLAGVVLASGGVNLRALAREDAEQTVLAAVARTRHEAVLTGRTVELRYDETARRFEWADKQLPVEGTHAVRLLPPETRSAVLLGGVSRETGALSRVCFYADGTCDPFRIEIVQTGDPAGRILTIDPWTATPLAEKGRASP